MSEMIKLEEKINRILRDPNLKDDIFDILDGSTLIIIREYKKQVPVDKAFTRNSVMNRVLYTGDGDDIGYTVTTLAQNYGIRYPVKLHQGTGKLKNAKDFGYTSGRVRGGDVQRGIGGIRPNKFADRTKAISGPEAVRFFKNEITKLTREK